MTSAFSWQNSISLCSASFCIPRPNLPVIPGISWLPTFAFQSPIMKRNLFWVLILKDLVGLHITVQLQLLQHYWGIDLDYCDIEWFALEMNRNHSVIFDLKTMQKLGCIQVQNRSKWYLSPHSLPQSSFLLKCIHSEQFHICLQSFLSLLFRHLNTKMYKCIWNGIILCPDLSFFTLQYMLENLLCQ